MLSLLSSYSWSPGATPAPRGLVQQRCAAMMLETGTVKWFNPQKGFGFIMPEDGGEELFVHQTAINAQGFRTLNEQEPVEFEIETEASGRRKAINVCAPGGGFVQGDGGGGGGGGGGRFETASNGAAPPRTWPEGTEPSSGKQVGTVKWFNSEKGFGFIVPKNGGPDVFVHQSEIYAEGFRSLNDGEDVEFFVLDDNGRAKAAGVAGPNGDYVQGAPRPEYDDDEYYSYEGDEY